MKYSQYVAYACVQLFMPLSLIICIKFLGTFLISLRTKTLTTRLQIPKSIVPFQISTSHIKYERLWVSWQRAELNTVQTIDLQFSSLVLYFQCRMVQVPAGRNHCIIVRRTCIWSSCTKLENMYEWAAFQFTSKCDMGQYLTQCLSQPVVSHTKQLSEISAALTGLVTSSFSLTNFCFFAIGSSMKRFASAYSIRVIYSHSCIFYL